MKNLIRFDWAIKRLLRNKANFGILEGFLSELLGEDIKIDHILESESNKQTADNKMNRVDLLVQNAVGELIIVEVQNIYMQDDLLRMLFGTSKQIVDNMDTGMPYGSVKKVISVNIVYFDLGHGDDYIYHGSTDFTGIHKQDRLKLSEQQVYHAEKIAQLYPEYYIIKVNQFDDVARDTLDEWINFLKNEVVYDGTKAKGLAEAKEKLDKLKLTKEERQEYEWDLSNWRDMESMMVSNYNAGQLQEKMAVAKKCLHRGMPLSEIAELTGLSEATIKSLMD
jgi:predicted transposase/invertase (TIGR01784 family)